MSEYNPDDPRRSPDVGHAEYADAERDPMEPLLRRAGFRGLWRTLRQRAARVDATALDESMHDQDVADVLPDTTDQTENEAESYANVKAMLSNGAFERHAAAIAEQQASRPIFAELDSLLQTQSALTKDFYQSSPGEEERQIQGKLDATKADIEEKMSPEYRFFGEKRAELQRGNILIDESDREWPALLGTIQAAAPIQPAPQDAAPFSHYASNTEQISLVTDIGEVKSYLASRLFIDEEKVHDFKNGLPYEDGSPRRITMEAKDEPFQIPLANVVSLQGFDSWLGRGSGGEAAHERRSGFGEVKGRSIDTIMHYASLPTEIPEVSEVHMYIQPDGKVFFDNGSGDSHRIAAAVLRGQESIGAKKITTIPISENIL